MSFRILLLPFSILFSFVVLMRNYLYQIGILKIHKVNKPILCVGNLTTGGTGKTPWVQLLSQYLIDNEKTHAIISRGYTGDFSGVLQVDAKMDPRKCGDEPLWLKRNTLADVFIGKNRVEVASVALKHFEYDCLLLDDGFQHHALKRDVDLIIVDASAPLFHYSLLPMGRMREGFSALKRAHFVIINKCNYAKKDQVDLLYKKIIKYKNAEEIFMADFVFDEWVPVVVGLPTVMNKENVTLSCGVGNPFAFEKTVEEEKIKPVKKFIYPDHYFWKPNDIEKMTYQMNLIKCTDLVVTEKDAVKLVRYTKHFKEMGIQVWICKMKIKIHKNEDVLFRSIGKMLNLNK